MELLTHQLRAVLECSILFAINWPSAMIHLTLFRKALLACILFAALAEAQDKSVANQTPRNSTASAQTQTLLQRAADSTDLSSEGQVFKISGTVDLPGAEGVNAQGTWVMFVAPEEKTYIDIVFADYRVRIWIQDQAEWL